MAEVWRAEAPGREGFVKEVALKLVRGDRGAGGDFDRMFAQEARLASRLNHANIVQVFDFDRVEGRYCIAMELVRGRTLREVADRCRELGLRLGLPRAVHVCAEVARALAYAHGFMDGGAPAGLVHRDVSPQNVLLSYEGEVKLTDFGIARALGSSDVTAPGVIKGKLAYMAPEQARGERVDGRADVFAVGVMLWELCAGRRLFARDSDAATLAAVMSPLPVSPPSAWNEAVPPELDAAVRAALEHDVAGRTATADELAAALADIKLRLATGHEDLDLRAFMRRLWPDAAMPGTPAPERTVVRGAPEPAGPGALEEQPTLATRTAARSSASPRRWLAVAGTAAAVVALGVAAWSVRGRAGARTANATATANATPTSSPAPAGEPSQARAPAPGGDETPPRVPHGERGQGSTPTAPSTEASTARTGAAPRPQAPRAEGRIAVRVTPWAYVTIDGALVGETPVDRRMPAGVHRLRAHHPKLGDDEVVVDLETGQRYVWKPKLSP